jgi:hypothetical protein
MIIHHSRVFLCITWRHQYRLRSSIVVQFEWVCPESPITPSMASLSCAWNLEIDSIPRPRGHVS